MSARSIEEQMAPLTAQDRTTAQLAVVFGCVALTLAAIGLYGVLSYGIARRTGEIAIRIALGAQPGRVISMIQQIAPLTAQDRTTAQLAVVFGGVALTLAAIGLYSQYCRLRHSLAAPARSPSESRSARRPAA